jgi:hypothetical protein
VGRRLIHDQKVSTCFRISTANKTSLSTTDPSRNLLQISALNRHKALNPILVFMQQSISSTTKTKTRQRGERERTSSPENTILLDSRTEMQNKKKRKKIQTQN